MADLLINESEELVRCREGGVHGLREGHPRGIRHVVAIHSSVVESFKQVHMIALKYLRGSVEAKAVATVGADDLSPVDRQQSVTRRDDGRMNEDLATLGGVRPDSPSARSRLA